jgi:2'-5' RNA ligase
LVGSCIARSHVTLLPPRPRIATHEAAWEAIQDTCQSFSPFRLELGPVAVFPKTNVVYLEIGAGSRALEEAHTRLNFGVNHCQERFPFHPHLTLAQGLAAGPAEAVAQQARARWAQYEGDRSFVVEYLYYVESPDLIHWNDLAELRLGHAASARLLTPTPELSQTF